MKKYFIAVGLVAFFAILFSFVNQPEKKKLEYKWFKYRTGETGVPTPSAFDAKQAANYVVVGDNPYCDGIMDGYCGIFAEPTDASSSALPILGTFEQSEIDAFFSNPALYDREFIDRTHE